MCKYQYIGNTMQCGMGDLPRAIVSAMANRGADGVPVGTTNYLQREFHDCLSKIQFHHEAELRRNVIQHTALETSGKRYYDIETVGGGFSPPMTVIFWEGRRTMIKETLTNLLWKKNSL